MQPRRPERPANRLGRALLVALLLHAQLIVPVLVVTWIRAAREEAQRAAEVDVTVESPSVDELPPDLPPIQDLTPEERVAQPRTKKPPAVAEVQPPPEEPERKPEEKPQPEPPPVEAKKQKPEDLAHKKIVDLDLGQEVEPPPDAKYLAQKNNRVKEETRATDTSLKGAQEGGEVSSPSERRDSKVGDERERVSGLEDRKSESPRDGMPSTQRPNGRTAAEQGQPGAADSTLLSMRGTQRREHEITPETVNPLLPSAVDGIWPAYRGPRTPRDAVDSVPRGPSGRHTKLALTGLDYERVFAAQADSDRARAREERSRRAGRFEERSNRLRAAVENFVPEVRPGNQTALNTRASPFAAFITAMHRQIHELWGFGFLEDLEGTPGTSRFNDMNLVTKMEIVLEPDGSVAWVGVVRTSGYTPFDAAAVDVVWSAGPYPAPPSVIHSGNGRTYLHWSFHRDARQCATAWADPFILNNAPADRDLVAGSTPRPGVGKAGKGAVAGAAGGDRELGAGRRREVAPAAARASAVGWFAAFGRRDVQGMIRLSGLPFRSAAEVVATSRQQLGPMLQQLVKESSASDVVGPELLSPAAARLALGRLPPAVSDNPDLVFALGQAGEQRLVLVLAEQEHTWKAVGLYLR